LDPPFIQETNLERWEAKLAEEQARGLHSLDKRDLSTELEELQVCKAWVKDECAIEVRELSQLVMGILDVLVDLGTFPIWDIPRQPKMAQGGGGLVVAILILEHL
jgi:hypothetical protein